MWQAQLLTRMQNLIGKLYRILLCMPCLCCLACARKGGHYHARKGSHYRARKGRR